MSETDIRETDLTRQIQKRAKVAAVLIAKKIADK